nr:DNA methyltransferase [Myxococcus xanthus]
MYLADCRDQLLDLPSASVDVLLTDPPYGMAYEGRGRSAAAIRADGSRQGMRVLRQALSAASAALAPDVHAYVYCHWESWPDFYDATSAHLRPKGALIWWKARGGMGDCAASYAPDYEVVLHAAGPTRRPLVGKRLGAVLAGFAPVPSRVRTHPTEKPVELQRLLIERSCPVGGLVLDPFAGSGSTLVAAQQLGRRAVGMELEERYCEAAARRLELALPEGPPKAA